MSVAPDRYKDIIKPLNQEHINAIGASFQISVIDQREAWAVTRIDPNTALLAAIMSSFEAWAIEYEGVLLGFFGVVVELDPEITYEVPWFICSQELRDKYWFKFAKYSKPIFDKIFSKYTILSNYVSLENTTAIRWLKWLGFKFLDKIYYFNKIPFTLFYKCMEHRLKS